MYAAISGFALLTLTASFLGENKDGVRLTSPVEEMFSSLPKLKWTVEEVLKEMEDVESRNSMMTREGGINYDLNSETSQNFTIYPFGSRFMGIGLRNSDYDVFIDIGGCYYNGGKKKPECMDYVRSIYEHLEDKNTSRFYDIKYLQKPKVPLMKAIHNETELHVDVSTRNAIGVENSKLIRGYLVDRRVKFVCAAVRLWARDQGLLKATMGPGAFSSYTMVWLVMFALMNDKPPAVVPVAELKTMHGGSQIYIDGWEVGHSSLQHPQSRNSKSEIELLQHFFRFYSQISFHDLKESVICPYTGNLISKSHFTHISSLPRVFSNYVDLARGDRTNYAMVCNTTLCLQDPMEQNNNIAKFVEDWAIHKFLESCKLTTRIINVIIKELRIDTNSKETPFDSLN